MTATKFGIIIGAVLALVWIIFGFWAFFFVLIAMIVGAVIGRFVDGKLDVGTLVGAFQGKRSSS
ncbi:DUF2273 domain-containing protein [Subtercola endophyticus]|uniref:DUF2273 domain-containing protein n=1 Tax=Subtercola endophyticus TaxID=2895559 RepID=UPI001E3EB21A|nr:DUF2273 domain-containing protein [Subtercola endophyticus]UFS58265.1 DUF2273 domain-containing protein [Subtercola endophyticus]